MNTLRVKNKIEEIAEQVQRFFIGITNAPKNDCLEQLLKIQYNNMEILTMSKHENDISLLQEIMIEVYKRKGQYDKQFINKTTYEGNTKWYKLFIAY